MKPYYSFNQYLQDKFHTKVRKISLNAGFSCPNRDEASGKKGCVFCNESGFSQFADTSLSLREQVDRSITFFKEKKRVESFIAYFQNATGTNAPVSELKSAYGVIREFPEIVGLSVSTRPDCIDEEKIDLIAGYADNYDVWIEYGLQTVHDRTLEKLNRGHTFAQTVAAIEKTAKKNIKVGVHVILGLPGETPDDMVETAKKISNLPVSGVKLHVLHILKGTLLEEVYKEGKMSLLNQNEYIRVACDFLENIREDCVILRIISDAKEDFLIEPKWINNKLEIIDQIENEFAARGTKQGILQAA